MDADKRAPPRPEPPEPADEWRRASSAVAAELPPASSLSWAARPVRGAAACSRQMSGAQASPYTASPLLPLSPSIPRPARRGATRKNNEQSPQIFSPHQVPFLWARVHGPPARLLNRSGQRRQARTVLLLLLLLLLLLRLLPRPPRPTLVRRGCGRVGLAPRTHCCNASNSRARSGPPPGHPPRVRAAARQARSAKRCPPRPPPVIRLAAAERRGKTGDDAERKVIWLLRLESGASRANARAASSQRRLPQPQGSTS